jgi:hypothetical protein
VTDQFVINKSREAARGILDLSAAVAERSGLSLEDVLMESISGYLVPLFERLGELSGASPAPDTQESTASGKQE